MSAFIVVKRLVLPLCIDQYTRHNNIRQSALHRPKTADVHRQILTLRTKAKSDFLRNSVNLTYFHESGRVPRLPLDVSPKSQTGAVAVVLRSTRKFHDEPRCCCWIRCVETLDIFKILRLSASKTEGILAPASLIIHCVQRTHRIHSDSGRNTNSSWVSSTFVPLITAACIDRLICVVTCSADNLDHVFKILLIGDAGVGKSR